MCMCFLIAEKINKARLNKNIIFFENIKKSENNVNICFEDNTACMCFKEP